MFNIRKKNWKSFDWLLFLTVIVLCVFGFFVLFSATKNLGGGYLKSQIAATVLGFVLVAIICFIDTDFLKRMYIPIYLLSVGLLVATIIWGFGAEEWGADSWLKIGPVTFQPSEFVKIGLMISLAAYLEKHADKMNQPLVLLRLLLFAALPVVLILLQPDFGTAMVFLFFIAVMFFVAGISWKNIGILMALALAAIPFLWSRLTDKQKDRILNFRDQSRDLLDSGYQAQQGYIAVGSGRLYGKGYLQGTQSQFGFIPERQTDFIFPVLVEELGFIGGLALILGYGLLFWRMIHISRNARDVFGSTLTMGAMAMMFIHVFENVGMTIGLMPMTGIPLPFFSYGGTFQLVNLIAIGLVLSVGMQKHPLDFNQY